MENQRLDELLEKYILKTATVEEQQELLAWYIDQNDGDVIWTADQLNEDVLVKRRLLQNINARTQSGWKRIKLWPRIAVAAAAVALIVLGVYFFNYSNREILKQVQDDVVVNDIAPGRNVATLTMGNGKTIMLSDAKSGVVINNDKLAYNDGSPLSPQGGFNSDGSKSSAVSLNSHGSVLPGGENRMITATTPRGGTYQVILPDGSKVWLNADSKLEFPSKFGKNEQRIVRLSGEGYFEVSKDKAHPFVVQTDKQEVTVLGTHFNISAYDDEASVKTTLLEGSVSVTPLSAMGRDVARDREVKGKSSTLSGLHPSLPEGENRILKPNQQAIVTGSSGIIVNPVDVSTVIDWKDGKFVCEDMPLNELLVKIARWYDVKFVYKHNQMISGKVTGTLSRTDNISKILKRIELTGEVKFDIQGRDIIISSN
jgi:transmembrane sensor